MNKQTINLLLIVLTVVSSGCVSSSNSNTQNPDEVVESYVNNLFGFSTNSEASYKLLSNQTQEQKSLPDYKTDIKNTKKYSPGTFKLENVELVDKTNTTANVSTRVRHNSGMGTYTMQNYVILVKEDNVWRINQTFSPF